MKANDIESLEIEPIFIGKAIEEELRRQERTVTWLSRKIHCDRRNIYDIFTRTSKIVAEIKALIPYEGARFGGAQIQSLEKDVDGLLHPDKKSKAQVNTQDLIKFLVLLSSQDENSFSEAVSHLKERLSKKGYAVTDHLPTDNEKLSTDTVYIVTLPLD